MLKSRLDRAGTEAKQAESFYGRRFNSRSKIAPERLVRPNDIDGFFGLFVDNLCQLIVIVGLCPLITDCRFHWWSAASCRASRFRSSPEISSTRGKHTGYRKSGAGRDGTPLRREHRESICIYLSDHGPSTARPTAKNWPGKCRWRRGSRRRDRNCDVLYWRLGAVPHSARSFALHAGRRRHHLHLDGLYLPDLQFATHRAVSRSIRTDRLRGSNSLALQPSTGFIAVILGTLAAWLLRGAHLASTPAWPDSHLEIHWPAPIIGEVFSLLTDHQVWNYSAIFIPMAVLNVIGSIQNLESAEAAGDKFPLAPRCWSMGPAR